MKAMTSTISNKQERKPQFFLGAPPSTDDSEGVEPRPSDTETGYTWRERSTPGIETNSDHLPPAVGVRILCSKIMELCYALTLILFPIILYKSDDYAP